MRMRTIDEAAAMIKAADPGTALTKTALRRLVTTGQLPSVTIGTKYLIALENLEAFLGGTLEQPEPDQGSGKIRRVEG